MRKTDRESLSLLDWAHETRHQPMALLILAVSPHLKVLTTLHFRGIQVDWLFYGLCFLVVLSRPSRLFTRSIIPLILVITFSLLPSILSDHFSQTRCVLNVLSFWLIYAACFEIVQRHNPRELIRSYVFFTFLASCWGILELVMGWNWSYGLDGLAYEPSHFVIASAPAAFFVLNQSGVNRYLKVIIPLAILLTLSSTALIVIAIISLLTLRSRAVTPLLLVLSLLAVWHYVPEVQDRVSKRFVDTIAFRENGQMTEFGSNKTTISLLSNAFVAKRNAQEYFPFGAGFSNHGENYLRHFEGRDFSASNYFGTNQSSGHNLAIRIFSEFGIAGVALLLCGFFRYLKRRRDSSFEVQILVTTALIHVIAKSVKLGSYLDYGTPMFVVLLLSFLFHPDKWMDKTKL